MADAAAARREARRRRILENSHNRLQLITGKSVDTIRQESPSSHSIPDDTNEVLLSSVPALSNGMFASDSELEALGILSRNQDWTAAGDGESSQAFPSPAGTSGLLTDTKPEPLLQKLIHYKYDIVLLAFIVQILYNCSLFIEEETYIFLPLVIYDVTKLIWFPAQTESNLAGVFLLFSGVSGAKAQRILVMWRVVQEVIRDGFLYLFTTICIQSLLTSMNLVT